MRASLVGLEDTRRNQLDSQNAASPPTSHRPHHEYAGIIWKRRTLARSSHILGGCSLPCEAVATTAGPEAFTRCLTCIVVAVVCRGLVEQVVSRGDVGARVPGGNGNVTRSYSRQKYHQTRKKQAKKSRRRGPLAKELRAIRQRVAACFDQGRSE